MINVQETSFYLMQINFNYMLSSRKKMSKYTALYVNVYWETKPEFNHIDILRWYKIQQQVAIIKCHPYIFVSYLVFIVIDFLRKKHNEIVCCLVSKIWFSKYKVRVLFSSVFTKDN